MNALTKTENNQLAISEDELMGVLQTSLYPGAAIPSIKMVIAYCKAANLDPMQKPVHIVPMYDSKSKQMRDVIMPGVNLYRIQAARAGTFAGMSEPEYGPDIVTTLGGVQVTYPEWCRVTVKRILGSGVTAEFTAREYWIENYALKGGTDKSIAPNTMWMKRPRGQIAKCASAQALRIAFPEIASAPTADEMEGKQIYPNDEAKPAGFSSDRLKELIQKVQLAQTKEEVTAIWVSGVSDIKESKDISAYAEFKAEVEKRGGEFKKMEAETVEVKMAEPADVEYSPE